MPVVKGLNVKKIDEGVLLIWHPIDKGDINVNMVTKPIIFLGYNIYRFISTGFVSRKSLNKFIITQNEFLDETVISSQPSCCYLVRAVFQLKKQQIEGPASQIICVE